MTIKQTVYKFIKHKPKNRKQIKSLGIKLKPLSSGVYRTTYTVNGLKLVLKLPINPSDIHHSNNEIKHIKKLSAKKYKQIHEYLPKIYYHDPKTGIILMRKYNIVYNNLDCEIAEFIIEKIYEKFSKLNVLCTDIHAANIGYTKKNKYKIIDFGMFGE